MIYKYLKTIDYSYFSFEKTYEEILKMHSVYHLLNEGDIIVMAGGRTDLLTHVAIIGSTKKMIVFQNHVGDFKVVIAFEKKGDINLIKRLGLEVFSIQKEMMDSSIYFDETLLYKIIEKSINHEPDSFILNKVEFFDKEKLDLFILKNDFYKKI